MNKIDIGAVSAYALAKEKGYQGTEEEFATLMMQSGDNALRAEAAADRAQEILGSIPPEYADLSIQVGENTENVAALTEEMDVLQDYGWSGGYIQKNGSIITGATGRFYSNLLICPPEVEVEYVGETNHTNISAIAFYNAYGDFISGVSNNGDAGTVVTTVSPAETAFCRLSANEATVDHAYYKPSTPVLQYVQNQITGIKEKFPGHPEGVTLSSTGIRATLANVDGYWRFRAVDEGYQIALYYTDAEGGSVNTGWRKEVIVTDYNSPTNLSIRKTDNSAFDVASARNAVLGERIGAAITNDQPMPKQETKTTYYVDCVNGNDANSGLYTTAAFATIQKAIDAGGKIILVREGTYTEGFTLTNATGVQILINKSYSAYNAETASNNPKIIIDCGNTFAYGADVGRCSDCVFEDIEVINATTYGWRITEGQNLRISNCVTHECAKGGFVITDTNAEFVNCIAYNIGVMGGGNHNDGFNIHGTGTTNFINCSAWNCEDDGISHHDACHGYIFGGELYNCGKGGVASPTHGATVDVFGVYSHDNKYGIYAMSTQGKSKGIIKDCILKDNTTADIGIAYADIKLLKNIYDTKNVDSTSNVVEIN